MKEEATQEVVKVVKQKKKGKFYVDPEEFRNAIKKYYEDGNCDVFLCTCLNKISEKLGYLPCFYNYSYKEEMYGDAIVKMFSALKKKKFDCTSETNPFNYFTTIAFNAFINRIKREKRHHETIAEFKAQKYEEMLTSGEAHIYVKPSGDSTEETHYFDQ